MQDSILTSYQKHYSFSDLALFDLLRAVNDLKTHENTLSSLDLEHIQIGAKVLNSLLARRIPANSQPKLSLCE